MRHVILSALSLTFSVNAAAQVEKVTHAGEMQVRSHYKDMSLAIKLSKQETTRLLECSVAHEFFVRLNGESSPRNVVMSHSMTAQIFLRAAYISSYYENGKPLLVPTTFGILLSEKSKSDSEMRNAINAKIEECAILKDISSIQRKSGR